jgi:hypothetical protein
MPKFRVSRTVRTYETLLLSREQTGNFSDRTGEWNVSARNAREAETAARAEGDNFRIDEVLSVTVRPFDEWRREMVAAGKWF